MSEGDGDAVAAASAASVNVRRPMTISSPAGTCDQSEDDDNPFLRDNVYFAAKDGLAIALYTLLAGVKDENVQSSIINQVRNFISILHCN